MGEIREEDLLRALDESVMRWCSDSAPEDRIFHGGIMDIGSPTDEELESAWLNHRAMAGADPDSVESLVFRNPSWDHIPDGFGRKEAPARNEPMTILPFGPFRHVRFIDGAPRDVLLSHWKGSVAEGAFLPPTAAIPITDELAAMFTAMARAYGRRSGWKGYTCRDDMVADATARLVAKGLGFNPLKSTRAKGYMNRVMNSAFIESLREHKQVWNHEFAVGDAIEEAVWDEDPEYEAGCSLEYETWAEASDREFEEGKREWAK